MNSTDAVGPPSPLHPPLMERKLDVLPVVLVDEIVDPSAASIPLSLIIIVVGSSWSIPGCVMLKSPQSIENADSSMMLVSRRSTSNWGKRFALMRLEARDATSSERFLLWLMVLVPL